MSSKPLHVQDTSIVERRLRPIYEWLDNGVNKKALQECDKVLKKTPSLQCAKALKAIALLRLGKAAESRTILDGLLAECPTDDSTLQAISICYRESNELEKICKVYEAALNSDRTSEELHSHLFMSYVRVGNFKEQQRVAMSLYKLKNRSPYYTWAVMSNVLQATRGPDSGDPQKRKLLLSLAERMMFKLIAQQEKPEGEHEGHLYVHILDMQDKREEVLKFLETPLGAKLLNGSLPFSRLPFLAKLGQWKQVNVHCKQQLSESIDKWNIWMEYLNSVFELMNESVPNHHGEITENGNGTVESVDDTPEKAHEFICSLIENGFNGYGQRGPYLARIELCYRLTKKGIDTKELLGEPIQLFVEYFRRFGHKPCCVSDLRIYLQILDSNRRTLLCESLLKDLNVASDAVAGTADVMQRHISAIQLSRLSGMHESLPPVALYEMANVLAAHYSLGYDRYGRGLLATDQGPSDPYAIIAAHILHDVAMTTQSSEPLICAVVVLENLLRNSKNCFHAKLLCVKFYHMLGGSIGAQSTYETLDLKHIQLDSLGFIHCARLPTTGLLALASLLYEATIKFFITNYRDSSDHLTFAYKYGSFLKIDEFMDFREQLYNSVHYTTVIVDRIVSNLVHCSSLEGITAADMAIKDNRINWELACDNNDLGVYLCWDPERIERPPGEWVANRELFGQNVAFARLRSHMVRTVSAAHDVVKSNEATRAQSVEALRNNLRDWENFHGTVVQEKHVPITEKFISLPLPSRLHGYLNVPYLRCLSYHIAIFLRLASEEVDDESEVLEKIRAANREVLGTVSELVGSQLTAEDAHWQQRKVMEHVVNCVEVMALSSFVLMLCHELLRPPHGKKSRRRTDTVRGREVVNGLVAEQQQALTAFVQHLDRWTVRDYTLENVMSRIDALQIERSTYNSVMSELETSLMVALKDLKAVLQAKCKALAGLTS